ncbi:MAG TPA: alpha-amylase family glycosyl hydrolase [Puia sp.]|nr:alpha-amylase family glycosyl hydrolase [Puia sp.]
MLNRLLCLLPAIYFFTLTACHPNDESIQNNSSGIDTSASTEHPSWSYQSNIYEVNLRQYSADGSFKEFAKSLPRLKEMGVEVLWFMPINPIGLEGRKATPKELGSYYAIKDYYAINKEFGTMDDWKSLVNQAHRMGFKVLMDWVANHSSPDNFWMTTHPDFYKRDAAGKAIVPNGWDDTRKLDYSNHELRDTMISAMKYWITGSDVDGFRCDDASDVPDDFWKAAIGGLRKMKTVFMLAEGDKPSLHDDGFDETYPWSVMSVAYGIYSGKTSLHQLDSVIAHNDSTFPKNAFRLYFTTNHDENSWNGTEFERFGEDYRTFAVWAFTMKNSVPLIYSGQEVPNKKRLKFFVKDTIRWNQFGLAPFYKTLNSLRRSTEALSADASFTKMITGKDNAVYAFVREKNGHKIVVLLNFSKQQQQFFIADNKIKGYGKNVFGGNIEELNTDKKFIMEPGAFIVYDYDVK